MDGTGGAEEEEEKKKKKRGDGPRFFNDSCKMVADCVWFESGFARRSRWGWMDARYERPRK